MPPRTRRSTNNNVSRGSDTHTVADCLADLGISDTKVFSDCQNLDEEFQVVKKIYFAAILEHHPDKGGDAAKFRSIRTAFEVLRDLKTNGALGSFTTHLQQATDDYYDTVFEDFGHAEHTPSYEHYYHAAQEQVPGYKVELARSGRSQCVACKNRKTRKPPKAKTTKAAVNETALIVAPPPVPSNSFIDKDAIRVGSLDDTSGSYGRWHHLQCWRVPYRIWAGLTNPKDAAQVWQDLLYMEDVLLTNLASLTKEQQQLVVAHVMDSSHWARKTAASKPPPNLKTAKPGAKAKDEAKPTAKAGKRKRDATVSAIEADPAMSSSEVTEQNLVVAPDTTPSDTLVTQSTVKEHFVIPRPGVNGAIANVLEQKRFVLTGVFPEVGGGAGLKLGKDRVRAMIESFGGVVTSSVSGKTNYLVVGKEPGASKVAKARTQGLPMVDLKILQTRILGRAESLETAGPPPVITSYSAGYQGRFIAN